MVLWVGIWAGIGWLSLLFYGVEQCYPVVFSWRVQKGFIHTPGFLAGMGRRLGLVGTVTSASM